MSDTVYHTCFQKYTTIKGQSRGGNGQMPEEELSSFSNSIRSAAAARPA